MQAVSSNTVHRKCTK